MSTAPAGGGTGTSSAARLGVTYRVSLTAIAGSLHPDHAGQMRIVLLTVGTRGDTEPFVALALGLAEAGHAVTLAARPDFADLVSEHGIEFAPLGNPYKPFITGAAEASAIGAGNGFTMQTLDRSSIAAGPAHAVDIRCDTAIRGRSG